MKLVFLLVLISLIQSVTSVKNTEMNTSNVILSHLLRTVMNMSGELHSTKSELASLKTSLTSTRDELESTKETLMSKVSRLNTLEEKTLLLENITKSIGNQRKAISFQVRQIKDQIVLSNNVVLKFDDVTMNEGNAYNPRSGIFIAPVPGTYIFWANVMSNQQKKCAFYIKLMKEGTVLALGYTTWELLHGVASLTYITKLKKGEHVWFATQFTKSTAIFGIKNSHYGEVLFNM